MALFCAAVAVAWVLFVFCGVLSVTFVAAEILLRVSTAVKSVLERASFALAAACILVVVLVLSPLVFVPLPLASVPLPLVFVLSVLVLVLSPLVFVLSVL